MNAGKQRGFTIVELLIVIVVIAILAAITIVAYNGIQQRARTSSVTTTLNQYAKKIALSQVDNSGQYPAALADIGLADTDTVAFQYTSDNSVSPATYCLTATSGTLTYYVSSTSSTPQSGVCTGYNMLAWSKKPGSTPPVPTAVVDTSVFRTTTESMRFGPNTVGQLVQGSPFSGTAGQTVYTVSLWVKTDATWNGTSNNSKIRFGDAAAGGPLVVCGYGGVKTSWTQVTCSYTMTATYPQITISVGNDGTTGNIWIDDFSLTRTN